MSKLVYTSYSPNTRQKDLIQNIKILLKPWQYIKGDFPQKIKAWFENYFKNSTAFTFNYARSGMYVLFKSLNMTQEDEVLIQGFTCVAAVNPVLWNGAKIKYIDIDPKSLNMDVEDLNRKITNKTKAVVFQYTFGNSQNIEKITQICKQHKVLLIEDCTNTILGKHNNQLIGTFGDAAIFSCGRDKAVSGVDGGVVLINNQSLLQNFVELYEKLNNPSWLWTLRELLFPIWWAMIKSTFDFLKLGKAIHYVCMKFGLLSLSTTTDEKKSDMKSFVPAKMPNALASLAYNQLEDISQINTHRNKISGMYESALKTKEYAQLFEFNAGNVLLRYPVLVENPKPLWSFMYEKKVVLGDWYTQPVGPAKVDLQAVGYKAGSCPNSEKVCTRIINLPNHVNISEADAFRILSLLNEFYES